VEFLFYSVKKVIKTLIKVANFYQSGFLQTLFSDKGYTDYSSVTVETIVCVSSGLSARTFGSLANK
jgi:hypothetical protein